MVTLLVCGSRSFPNDFAAWLVIRQLVKAMVEEGVTHIIHGDAQGADKMAAQAAEEFGIDVTAFPAEWDLHGRRAGVIRNQVMLDTDPQGVVAFWNGESRGTMDMISRARAKGTPVKVMTLCEG